MSEYTKRQEEYMESVRSGLEGIEAVSSGVCPGCTMCADRHELTLDELEVAWSSGEVYEEAYFGEGCDACGTWLAGNLYLSHGLIDGEIVELELCTDCVLYIANGDVPEFNEEQRSRK